MLNTFQISQAVAVGTTLLQLKRHLTAGNTLCFGVFPSFFGKISIQV
jgi:hypothetical protein